jgi:hypothetical protein
VAAVEGEGRTIQVTEERVVAEEELMLELPYPLLPVIATMW